MSQLMMPQHEGMSGQAPSQYTHSPSSLDSSSSLRTASWMWRGVMRPFLLSRAALPASSSTSAACDGQHEAVC